MYLFCNLRIHVITLYSGHVSVYYASMLRCWHLVWILVRTDHPCLGVGCYNEGICGTHQLTHKMKWLLQRVGFYWSTMLNDCFRYYKGCESCLGFRRQYYVQSKNGTKLCVLKHAYACIFESMLSITESELQTELRQVDSPSNKRTAAPPYSPPLPPNKSQWVYFTC
jgi:hypothetical protein